MKTRRLVSCLLAGLLAAALRAQEYTLASELPANTFLYVEIPDVQGFMASARGSALGQIHRDPSVQAFVSGFEGKLAEGWSQVRAMASALGVPSDVLHWESVTSFECGLALGPVERIGAPDGGGYPIAATLGAAVGLRGDLAQQVFALLSNLATAQGKGEIVEEVDGPVLAVAYAGDEKLRIRVRGKRLVAFARTGAPGVEGLSGSAQFLAGRQVVGGARDVLFLYMNAAAFVNLLDDGLQAWKPEIASVARRVLDESGLSSFQYLALASGWRGADSVGTAVVGHAPGSRAGTGHAVDLSLLEYVPGDVTAFGLFTADAGDAWGRVRRIWAAVKELEVAPGQTLAASWPGFQPGHPLYEWMEGGRSEALARAFAGIGHQGFWYTPPSAGALGAGANTSAFVRLTDAAAVREALGQLMPQAAEWLATVPALPLALEVKNVPIRERDAAGQTVTREGPQYYVLKIKAAALPKQLAPLQMLLAQFQPSLGVTPDDWLVIGMNRMSVSSALRKGVQRPEASVTANSDVQAFLGRLPAGVESMSWSDPRPGVEQMFAMAQMMLGVVTAQIPADKMPVDLEKLPPATSITAYLRPTESHTVVEGTQLVTRTTGSLDVADFLVLGGAAATAAVPLVVAARQKQPEHAQAGAAGAGGAAAGPGPAAAAGPDAKVQAARDELDRLRAGLTVFRLEHNRYPAELRELAQPDNDYPFGYLPDHQRGLVNDPWGRAFVYRLTPEGCELYSVGPNGADEGGKGDDVKSAD